jgi:SAM-dependent methyltransferase
MSLSEEPRRVVLYAYCERGPDTICNLRFFVANGMQCPRTHYVFIVNGPAEEPLPLQGPTVTVIRRENRGFDFGGWAAGLAALTVDDYDHFVFLNGSCCGPFLPGYCHPREWVTAFCSRLQGLVHCVGPTINVFKTQPRCRPHVQTYAWAVTRECMAMLLARGLFAYEGATKDDVILHQEVGMGSLVIAHGWELACFVREYDAIVTYQPYNEAQLRAFNPCADCFLGDITIKGPLCFGRDLQPMELMFMKANRGHPAVQPFLELRYASQPAPAPAHDEPASSSVAAHLTFTYGSSGGGGSTPSHHKDVTMVVRNLLAHGIVQAPVSNLVFGDPCPGVPKQVSVWHADGRLLLSMVPEHATLQLAPVRPVDAFRTYAPVLQGARGLEVGGPSLDMAPLGVYTAPAHLDNANYSAATLWNAARAGTPYTWPKKSSPGTVHIVDAVDLASAFAPDTYDFVFSSHVLEHLVNPLKALHQMARVTRPGGYALHVLPWKTGTFDHRRPITAFAELVQHFEEDRDESDVTDHLDEVVANYDLDRDPPAGTWPQFLDRCRHHAENRALHVHVFDFGLLAQCLHHAGFSVLDTQLVAPIHQVVLARKNHV